MQQNLLLSAVFISLTLFSLGCATARSGGDVSATEPKGVTPGKQCLQDARAVRSVPLDAPEKIELSHILVRHAELRDPHGATRSREEACLMALRALDELRAGGDWSEVVSEYSESGQSTAGELGRVSREELTGSFGDAAFALSVNELSYVVESDRGYHVILRTQ